jgi:hypothetical protein
MVTESYLYRNYFAPKVQLPYDTRIDDYNWLLIFASQFIFYFFLHVCIRKFVPPPGDIKSFQERKRMRDYNSYYFQYLSLFHALACCIFSNSPSTSYL